MALHPKPQLRLEHVAIDSTVQDVAAEYIDPFDQGESPEVADAQMQNLLGEVSEQVGRLNERAANLEAIIVAETGADQTLRSALLHAQ